ncbi:Nitrate reductase [Desulfotomaculum nigrificans CO-1-SRB]|uniref:Nitrate reductase n=1 Tax=Desulfotomaculum nigrificans (strain DSM 14880 / VKM B-2319 / CO-1-SRB) TaxID=868595 RepID=F6B9D9_DESCC|nr:molybdopterin-dependent oxidoreductase [Desulfotomaculum nigrificans]AEF93715.1 Nitrate reductase [Desulfotomaculum nigrificans CO-1-SRB]
MPKIRTACPMDCYSHCGLVAQVEDGKIIQIDGDVNHPLNKGLICQKGRVKHLQRIYSPQRITTPLRKTSAGWQSISWSAAYDIIAEKLTPLVKLYGPTTILHHDNCGSEGILKSLSRRFFSALGGCTRPQGSICWGSGYQAQVYDFGRLQLHSWEDVLNSRLIILWGRDPASTNIHMLSLLQQAKKQGAKIIVINPVEVASCRLADWHIAPRPGSDGALALAVANEIIKNDWINQDYIDKHVFGYPAYRELVAQYPAEKVSAITGIPVEQICTLAREYGTTSPASIFFGYGLQRYTNGGQTVRAIDALAAITGNIGIPGGGANYAGGHWKGMLADITGSELSPEVRRLPWPTLAEAMLKANDPPIKAIFVTRSNPLTQLPDTSRVKEAFSQSELTVVVDFFLNDTAQMADLVLPCTTFLEGEDVVYSSWNHYMTYQHQVVSPVGQCRSDHHIFAGLAQHMGLPGFPNLSDSQWLEQALAPLAQYGVTLDKLKEGPVRHPLAPDVPWHDGNFATPSGKFELYSQLAEADGVNPLPDYVEPAESPLRNPGLAQNYPLHLITVHHPDYLHSQFWNLSDAGQSRQPVYLHPDTAAVYGIEDNAPVIVATSRGQITCQAKLSPKVRPDTALLYEGHWLSHGNGVNLLTGQYRPDMGLGTPYYDCLCRVTPKAGLKK